MQYFPIIQIRDIFFTNSVRKEMRKNIFCKVKAGIDNFINFEA